MLLLLIIVRGSVMRADTIAQPDSVPRWRPLPSWSGIALGAGMAGVAAGARQIYPQLIQFQERLYQHLLR